MESGSESQGEKRKWRTERKMKDSASGPRLEEKERGEKVVNTKKGKGHVRAMYKRVRWERGVSLLRYHRFS